MYSIVPLAGPDFLLPSGKVKPLWHIQGETLIEKVITSRYWYVSGKLENENIIFVLRKTEKTQEFIEFLQKKFPRSKYIVLSNLTNGALLSALAGVSLIKNFNAPVCIDLADIMFDCHKCPLEVMQGCGYDGLVPFFESQNSKFSYVQIEGECIKNIREKEVISNNASAGVYFFKNVSTFLEASAGSFLISDEISYKGSMFLAPSYNALLKKSCNIAAMRVKNVQEFSTTFYE
ncbi:MAG: hypothetical protein ACI9CD_000491 [Candidatus Deianiraeaceae bacterium]|jgi:hypothetical protein